MLRLGGKIGNKSSGKLDRHRLLRGFVAACVLCSTLLAQEPVTKPKLSPLADPPDWSVLDGLAGTLSREEFEVAMTKIYLSRAQFTLPWTIDDEGLQVTTSPGQAPWRIAFRKHDAEPKVSPRYWRLPKELPPLKPDEPVLKGVHIALDPGHIGGGYAEMEERWLSMSPGESIMEGHLVLRVAELLKPRLEALGATVTMVRQQEAPVTKANINDLKKVARQVLLEAGIPKPVENYGDRVGDERILTVQWQTEKLFYRVSEIHARAYRVNEELRPDLVLCLHLNAEAWGDPRKPAFVDKNHLHLMVNGCYSAEELQFEDIRFDMLRRVFGRVHQQEIAMADVVAGSLAKSTGLPPYVYITTQARRVSENPYVFARNLLANRLYQCPVLYFEPYVMNHEQTYKRLLLDHYIGRTLLDGQLVSSPLEDYTRGVVDGLVTYFQSARNPAP
ncbi:hypothetical protein BH11VER1_BH11VER1_32350 [soil metagenome]